MEVRFDQPAATGAVIVARDGAYVDTLMVVDELLELGAGERIGTYDLTIEKEGYRPWRRSEIRVDRDNPCHVTPVLMEARLERQRLSGNAAGSR